MWNVLVELPSFLATRDVVTVLEKRKYENGKKKNMEDRCSFYDFFFVL